MKRRTRWWLMVHVRRRRFRAVYRLGYRMISPTELPPTSGEVTALATNDTRAMFVLVYWLATCLRVISGDEVANAAHWYGLEIVGPPGETPPPDVVLTGRMICLAYNGDMDTARDVLDAADVADRVECAAALACLVRLCVHRRT